MLKSYSKQNIKDIKSEIEEIKDLQNEVAINYFKKGSISRKTYDKLMMDHTIRLAKLNKDFSKSKNKDKLS